MLVGERMSKPVISITPETTINVAFDLLRKNNIRRLPVLSKDGNLIGIVTELDLINASPSLATTLSKWEMNYLLEKITIEKVMSRDVITVDPSTPIEQAAKVMVDNKISGMPVMENGKIIGMITETDLFKVFLELMGGRDKGVRVTAVLQDVQGKLADLTLAISKAGGNFISLGAFDSDQEDSVELTFKLYEIDLELLRKTIEPFVTEIKDIRIS